MAMGCNCFYKKNHVNDEFKFYNCHALPVTDADAAPSPSQSSPAAIGKYIIVNNSICVKGSSLLVMYPHDCVYVLSTPHVHTKTLCMSSTEAS